MRTSTRVPKHHLITKPSFVYSLSLSQIQKCVQTTRPPSVATSNRIVALVAISAPFATVRTIPRLWGGQCLHHHRTIPPPPPSKMMRQMRRPRHNTTNTTSTWQSWMSKYRECVPPQLRGHPDRHTLYSPSTQLLITRVVGISTIFKVLTTKNVFGTMRTLSLRNTRPILTLRAFTPKVITFCT